MAPRPARAAGRRGERLAAQAVAEAGRKYAPRGSGRLPKRHLFVRGMLRCGLCEEAMLPRSASHSRDVYVCRTRKQTGGAGACPMPPLPRVSVVYAALRLFQPTSSTSAARPSRRNNPQQPLTPEPGRG